MDESKSLVSFQIAGLLIQNSFRYLLNAMKSFNKRRLFRAYTVWKNRTIAISKLNQVTIKNSIVALWARLKKLDRTMLCKVKFLRQDAFCRVIIAASAKEYENKMNAHEQSLKNFQDNELQGLSKNLKIMQDGQESHGKGMKKIKSREENFKIIGDTTSRRLESKSRKRNVKEENFLERIKEVKEENVEIKEKIALIEKNISIFLNEVTGLLETADDVEKSAEKRKGSSKKVKMVKKARAALNTLDLSTH
jgi:hypothetical protein